MGFRSLVACLALSALAPTCSNQAGPEKAPAAARTEAPTAAPTPAPTAAPTSPPAAAKAPDLFASSVRPILKARCAPCHEPGGSQYEKLPFDRPETLASHRAGALKRLKGDDRAAFEEWLRTMP